MTDTQRHKKAPKKIVDDQGNELAIGDRIYRTKVGHPGAPLWVTWGEVVGLGRSNAHVRYDAELYDENYTHRSVPGMFIRKIPRETEKR